MCSLSSLEEAWLGQGNMNKLVTIEIGTSTQIEIDTAMDMDIDQFPMDIGLCRRLQFLFAQ